MSNKTKTEDEEFALHRKYRPQTLKRVIGHDAVVNRLRGIVESGKIPSAMAFFGPPSAGKTTLARAFAAEINQKPVSEQADFKEVNAADQRSIDDIRELTKLSKFRPLSNRRFILIDEAQQLTGNAAALQCLLKPLEEPSKGTTWIICSMEPAKLQASTLGKAILTRCNQFILEPHTEKDLLKQALRIAKGEKMKYLLTEDNKLLKSIARASNNEMRTLANVMQTLQQYYDGLEDKPKRLKLEHISGVLASIESSDDKAALKFMVGVYSRKFAQAQTALLDVSDGFSFIKKLVWMSSFMLNVSVLNGQKHSKVWWSSMNRELHSSTKGLKLSLGDLACVNAHLVKVQAQAASFQVPVTDLLSSEAYYLIKELAK